MLVMLIMLSIRTLINIVIILNIKAVDNDGNCRNNILVFTLIIKIYH